MLPVKLVAMGDGVSEEVAAQVAWRAGIMA